MKLETSPEFSNRFLLTGKDAGGIRRLFSTTQVNFLLNANLRDKWRVEGAGPWLVFYQPQKRLLPKAWAGFLEQASQLAMGFFQNASKAELAQANAG